MQEYIGQANKDSETVRRQAISKRWRGNDVQILHITLSKVSRRLTPLSLSGVGEVDRNAQLADETRKHRRNWRWICRVRVTNDFFNQSKRFTELTVGGCSEIRKGLGSLKDEVMILFGGFALKYIQLAQTMNVRTAMMPQEN